MLDFLNSPAFHAFGAPTSWAEIAGFATGAWCVWLVVKVNIWNWPVGIANAGFFLLLFGTAHLYADAALQGVYIALGAWGWWLWARGKRQDTLPVTRSSRNEWAVLAVLLAVGTAGMTLFLRSVSDTAPFWDALTTALSLLATWGQAKKRVESWWLWIAADAIYVPLYQYKHLTLTAILYVGFAALCVAGLRSWTRDMRSTVVSAPPALTQVPVPSAV